MINKETLTKYIKLMRASIDQAVVTKQEFLNGYLKALDDLENVFLSHIDDKIDLLWIYT